MASSSSPTFVPDPAYTVSRPVRVFAYWLGFILAAATMLATGVIGIYWPHRLPEALALAGVINSVSAFVLSGLAVTHTPKGDTK